MTTTPARKFVSRTWEEAIEAVGYLESIVMETGFRADEEDYHEAIRLASKGRYNDAVSIAANARIRCGEF